MPTEIKIIGSSDEIIHLSFQTVVEKITQKSKSHGFVHDFPAAKVPSCKDHNVLPKLLRCPQLTMAYGSPVNPFQPKSLGWFLRVGAVGGLGFWLG